MTTPTTEDLVRQCLAGNAVDATSSFEMLALDRIADRIADRKAEMAVSILTPGAPASGAE